MLKGQKSTDKIDFYSFFWAGGGEEEEVAERCCFLSRVWGREVVGRHKYTFILDINILLFFLDSNQKIILKHLYK